MYLLIILLIVLVLLGYSVYRMLRRTTPAAPAPAAPEAPVGKVCEFEGEDLFNRKVFKKSDNSIVTANPKSLQCSECVDYMYRAGPNECYEFEYTNKDKEVVGVCLAKTVASKCTY